MRYSRQDKILELIRKYDVDTQETLASLLKSNGYDVTQATVSRDIKDLHLIKVPTPDGRYRYALPDQSTANKEAGERYVRIFRNTLLNVSSAGNIIVLKTLTGCANAAAEAVDSLGLSTIVGTIAGDNTIFILVDDEKNVSSLVKRFHDLIGVG